MSDPLEEPRSDRGSSDLRIFRAWSMSALKDDVVHIRAMGPGPFSAGTGEPGSWGPNPGSSAGGVAVNSWGTKTTWFHAKAMPEQAMTSSPCDSFVSPKELKTQN